MLTGEEASTCVKSLRKSLDILLLVLQSRHCSEARSYPNNKLYTILSFTFGTE